MENASILPYCISHNESNHYQTYVSSPKIVSDNNGDNKIQCLNENKLSTLYNKFYAINPMLNMLPRMSKLFCFKHSESFPYELIDIEILADIYNIQPNRSNVYFIAWTEPVVNTSELYLYHNNNSVFVSILNNKPAGYVEYIYSPIYILTDEYVHGNFNNIKFSYLNNRCVPIVDKNSAFFSQNDVTYFESIQNCLTYMKLQQNNNITISQYIKAKNVYTKYMNLVIFICIFIIVAAKSS